eukprot:3865474-Lingulodinium_polyedra.AAC.1
MQCIAARNSDYMPWPIAGSARIIAASDANCFELASPGARARIGWWRHSHTLGAVGAAAWRG